MILILEHTLDFLPIPSKTLELHESIGDGAFGTVYRATWLTRNHIVAVKKLHLIHWNKKAKIEFFKELSFIDILRSPHIVNFYGACIETDNFALVMEYMSLGSLYKMLHDDNVDLVWALRFSIALQTAKCINCLHTFQPSILHRDIKSANFLLERAYEGYTVKVCDFGLAETRIETSRQTTPNVSLIGTLQWSAPEILRLEKHTDKSDVYSLGIVYWELATNEIPYGGRQIEVVHGFVRSGDRLQIPETTPPNFSALIQECWAHNPNDRPCCSRLIEVIKGCIKNQIILNIPANARWIQNGTTVAGGNEKGSTTNQLDCPHGIFVDDDQMIIIADCHNHRIIEWRMGDTNGQVVAGGKGQGNRLDQLNGPTDVLLDKETNSLIICDRGNGRIVRWSRHDGTTEGEILIYNIWCWGLAMDNERYLYVCHSEKHEIRRYKIGDKNGILVAGGNGKGYGLDQLNYPRYLFVDRQQTVYVSDYWNHRIMQWNKDAKEGIVVAGVQGQGKALTQLRAPYGLFVDTLGTIYVADELNHRVMRWPKGAKQGTVIVGENDEGEGANQFNHPLGLCFDRNGNLYVVDEYNNRVQFFEIQ
ncbi:unnamed protein product [Rotaria sp. Silwood2]|nr:unnamed protein product [Rotaria sp. Silwood2]CAF4187595.1 unnamed protein product [Rotaria sp. Silwood2]